jgi:uncharacterized protein (TIGR02145 family)
MKKFRKPLPISFTVFFLILILLGSNACKKDKDDDPQPSITDIDGNVYQTVKIGNQIWMKENLKTTKYRNGDPIPNVTLWTPWLSATQGAFCHYQNVASWTETYGLLYNWFAVGDARQICPSGWHVPTKNEWNTLINFAGGENEAGNRLKEKGIVHWNGPNSGASDAYGFTALPGGYRTSTFDPPGFYAIWWSSTPESPEDSWIMTLVANNSNAYIERQGKFAGHAIRCVKD